jgi:3-oxoacyl-(acyl-carrier-protein) synthase
MGTNASHAIAAKINGSLDCEPPRRFAPTLKLDEVDRGCAPLDCIRGEGRAMDTGWVMSNDFAFGGINTALVLRRWA